MAMKLAVAWIEKALGIERKLAVALARKIAMAMKLAVAWIEKALGIERKLAVALARKIAVRMNLVCFGSLNH